MPRRSTFPPESFADREARLAGDSPEDNGPRCEECGFLDCECEAVVEELEARDTL